MTKDTAMYDYFFSARTNPLMMVMLEKFNEDLDPESTAISFLQQCVQVTGKDAVKAALRERCSKCTNASDQIPIAPNHPVIIDHIINPLLEAKKCFILNLPIACIALSGFVGEMVALWRFQMLDPKINGKVLDDNVQKQLFGSTFEKLGQDKRVKVLYALEDINDEIKEAFDKLRNIRKSYLHFMVNREETDVDKAAIEAFELACMLVAKTLNLTSKDGAVIFPPNVDRFMRDFIKAGAQTT